MRETERTAAELAQSLRTDLANCEAHATIINTAMAEMQQAVTERRLPVYAVLESQTYATRRLVDPDLFIRFPLSVHLHGRIAPRRPGLRYRGPCFESAAFKLTKVHVVWPPPPVAAPGAYEWLLAAATRDLAKGKPAKQADIVKRCIAAIGGTVRETAAVPTNPSGKPPGTFLARGGESKDNPTDVSFDFVGCLISTIPSICAQ